MPIDACIPLTSVDVAMRFDESVARSRVMIPGNEYHRPLTETFV